MRAEDVPIEAPCHEDWDRMRPEAGDQRRWCEHCERHVHDLSRMGERAARALLREMAGREVCIAYLEDEHGEVGFVPEPRMVPLSRLASAATIAMLLSACTPHGEPERALQVELPESSTMLTPSSVIPSNSYDFSNEADPPAAEAPCDPPVVSQLPKKGRYKHKMGALPKRDDLDGL
jgi:hypothetical protein